MHKNNIVRVNPDVVLLNEEADKETLLNQWIQDYGNDVIRTAYLFLKDSTLADDIFQEVFLKAYKHMYEHRGESSVKTWLLRITINQCKDYLKSSWVKRMLLTFGNEKEEKTSNLPEDIAILNEEKRQLLQSVFGLSIRLREIIILHYYHELNENEIASMLNIPQGTVRSRLHRAKTALKIDFKIREDKQL
jgi:RNA polymerase sigma-70 factor (ECF subfamily)